MFPYRGVFVGLLVRLSVTRLRTAKTTGRIEVMYEVGIFGEKRRITQEFRFFDSEGNYIGGGGQFCQV